MIFGILKRPRARKWLLLAVLLTATICVSGCRTLGFYAQAIGGQYQIFAHRRAIDKIVADPKTSAELKGKLELIQRLREFADKELKLPVDGHYLKYADVHREYVVWNVQAAPQFSLEPKTWWYPLVGSLEYRGYFSSDGAKKYGQYLTRKGYDVFVGGVDAYSTLGWFKDPVLNTFISRPESDLAELIFHELGHQRVFARGDTDFNEAFATTVGQEGARRWIQAAGDTNLFDSYLVSMKRNEQFVRLIMRTRATLEAIYGDERDKDGNLKAARKPPAPAVEMQARKERVFDDLRAEYAVLKEQWNGYKGYDAWFSRELNNAQLNTIANYYDYVPGFEQLLQLKDGDMKAFYAAAERLANMPKEERHQWLRNLADGGKLQGALGDK